MYQRKSIFAASILKRAVVMSGLLFAVSFNLPIVNGQQQMSAETKTKLCQEKEANLKGLEHESSNNEERIREIDQRIMGRERFINFQNLTPKQIDAYLNTAVRNFEDSKKDGDEHNMQYWRKWMDFFRLLSTKEFFGEEQVRRTPFYQDISRELGELNEELKPMKEKQTNLVNQISSLRNSIKSLGCDCLPATGGARQKSVDAPCKKLEEQGTTDACIVPNVAGTYIFTSGYTGIVKIEGQGGTVTGRYGADENSLKNTITGTFKGGNECLVLEGEFVNTQYKTEGKFTYTFSRDGTSFTGTWNNTKPDTVGGTWNAARKEN